MRIEFERTGGFAGMRTTFAVDTDNLAPEAARELNGLIEAARFFELPAVIASPALGADQFQYRLTVDDAGRAHTIAAGETAAPETLQALFRQLTTMARSARGS